MGTQYIPPETDSGALAAVATEALARTLADNTLTTAVGLKASTVALNAETVSRTDADTALDGRLDTVENDQVAEADARADADAALTTSVAGKVSKINVPFNLEVDGGADPTGVSSAATDAAFVAALAELIPATDPSTTTRRPTRALEIGPGVFAVTVPPLALRSVMGFVLKTAGRQLTRLRAVASMDALIDLNGVAYSELGAISLEALSGDGAPVVDTMLRVWHDNVGGSPTKAARSTTQNHFDFIEAVGRFRKGVHLGADGQVVTSQVDVQSFDHLSVKGSLPTTQTVGSHTLPVATVNVVSTTGFDSVGTAIVGGQTVTYTGKTATSFTGCAGGTGVIAAGYPVIDGLLWQSGLKVGNGVAGNNFLHSVHTLSVLTCRRNLHIYNSGMEVHSAHFQNAEADIYVDALYSDLTIKGLRGEGSQRFLQGAGGTTVAGSVSIDDVDWKTASIHPDGNWINWTMPGILKMGTIRLGDSGGVVPVIKSDPTRRSSVIIDGFQSYQTLDTAFNLGVNVDLALRGYKKLTGSGAVDTTGYIGGVLVTDGYHLAPRNGLPDVGILRSTAHPEGVLTAPPGYLCLRTDGTIYKKATGTGNTGWVEFAAGDPVPSTMDAHRTSDVESMPRDLATANLTVTDGDVVAVRCIAKAAGTFTKLRLVPGTITGLTFFQGGVWNSTGTKTHETGDLVASAVSSTVLESVLDTPITVTAGEIMYLGAGMVGGSSRQIRGAVAGSTGLLVLAPKRAWRVGSYAGGALPNLSGTGQLASVIYAALVP